jgi:hypothetical protein
MSVLDSGGHELHEGARVIILREIEMERLFAGYDAALAGKELPRDLQPGDEGQVIEMDDAPAPVLIVEFRHQGAPFWRGELKPEEIRLKAA